MAIVDRLDDVLNAMAKLDEHLPDRFDDTFIDKLIDYLPDDEKTIESVRRFVDNLTSSSGPIPLSLALRLYDRLSISDHDRLILIEKCRSNTVASVRDAYFRLCNRMIGIFTRDQYHECIEMALQSLRNNSESIFVSRSAQHLLITVLSNDNDLMISRVFVDILLGATSSLILDSVSTILLDPSIHITIDDEQCKQLIVNAQQQKHIAYNYARLIARCCHNLNNYDIFDQKWTNRLLRLSIIKHLIITKDNTNKELLFDRLLNESLSTALIGHFTDIMTILSEKDVIRIVNKMINQVNVNVSIGLEQFLKTLPDTICDQFAHQLLSVIIPISLTQTSILQQLLTRIDTNIIASWMISHEADRFIIDLTDQINDSRWESRDSALEIFTFILPYISSGIYMMLKYCYLFEEKRQMISQRALAMAVDDPSYFVRASAYRLLMIASKDTIINSDTIIKSDTVIKSDTLINSAIRSVIDDPDAEPRLAALHLLDSINVNCIVDLLPTLIRDIDIEIRMATVDICCRLITTNQCIVEAKCALDQLIVDDTDCSTYAQRQLQTIDNQHQYSSNGSNNLYEHDPLMLLDDMFNALNLADTTACDENNLKDCY